MGRYESWIVIIFGVVVIFYTIIQLYTTNDVIINPFRHHEPYDLDELNTTLQSLNSAMRDLIQRSGKLPDPAPLSFQNHLDRSATSALFTITTGTIRDSSVAPMKHQPSQMVYGIPQGEGGEKKKRAVVFTMDSILACNA